MTVGLDKQCFSTYNFFKETENISHFQMTKIHILRVPQAANLNSWDFGPMQKSSLTFVICCCCCSVAKSRPTLCDPVDCSTPGFPVLHHLLEFAQTHVHWVSDAAEPSHPLSAPSPPTFNLSQYQSLFQCVGPSHQVAKILELQLQHQSFQWIFRTDFL